MELWITFYGVSVPDELATITEIRPVVCPETPAFAPMSGFPLFTKVVSARGRVVDNDRSPSETGTLDKNGLLLQMAVISVADVHTLLLFPSEMGSVSTFHQSGSVAPWTPDVMPAPVHVSTNSASDPWGDGAADRRPEQREQTTREERASMEEEVEHLPVVDS